MNLDNPLRCSVNRITAEILHFHGVMYSLCVSANYCIQAGTSHVRLENLDNEIYDVVGATFSQALNVLNVLTEKLINEVEVAAS